MPKQPFYKVTLAVVHKKLNVQLLTRYHLILQINQHIFKVSCIDLYTHQCLLLLEFVLLPTCSVIDCLKRIYEKYPILGLNTWSQITISIGGHQYTNVPKSHFIKNYADDYLRLACSLDQSQKVVTYFDHWVLDTVLIFAMPSTLKAFFSSYYKNNMHFIHQGSGFIEGVRNYLQYYKYKAIPQVSVLVEENFFYITVLHPKKLYYFNRFEYKNSDELLHYILLIMQQLQINAQNSEVIFWGKITKDMIKKFKNYIYKTTINNRIPFIKLTYSFKKCIKNAHFDLLMMYLCKKMIN